jgi:hypothetical protein
MRAGLILHAVTHFVVPEYKKTGAFCNAEQKLYQRRRSLRFTEHTRGLLAICGQRLMMCCIYGKVNCIMRHYG